MKPKNSARDPRPDDADPRRPGDPEWRERVAHRTLPADIVWALQDARHHRGWTQREAAAAVGISLGTVRHLEHGDRLPSVDVAEDLVATLDLPPDVVHHLRAVARPYAGRSSPLRHRYPPGTVTTHGPTDPDRAQQQPEETGTR